MWDFATEMSSQYDSNHVAALIKQNSSLHGFTVASKAAVLIAHIISSTIFVMNLWCHLLYVKYHKNVKIIL